MQIFESRSDFGCIESSVILGDAFARPSLERAEEFTSTAVLHAQIQMLLGLKRVIESDDEGMVACCQYFLLSESSLDLVAFDHFLFAQYWKVLVVWHQQIMRWWKILFIA